MVSQEKVNMTYLHEGYLYIKIEGSPIVTVYDQESTQEVDIFYDHDLEDDHFQAFEEACLSNASFFSQD